MRVQHLRDAWAKSGRSRQTREDPAEGVLLISSGGLGDTVLLSHVIERFVAIARPDESVTIILRSDGAKTAFLFSERINVHKVDYDRLRRDQSYRNETAATLHAQNYRLAISLDYLRHPYLDEFLLLAAAAEETIAMRAKPWSKYDSALAKNAAALNRTFDSGPAVYDKLARWVDFANWLLGTDRPVPKAILPAHAKDAEAIPDNSVYIQAFSAVHAKQPLPQIFADILSILPDDCSILFTGAPGEETKNPDYGLLFDDKRVSYDARSFEDILPALRTARLVVSVDTAFLHLSIAAGAPTLGLLSAAYVGEIVPYRPEATPDNVRFVYHDMPCRSCLGDCSLPAENDRFPCIARIPRDTVIEAVREML